MFRLNLITLKLFQNFLLNLFILIIFFQFFIFQNFFFFLLVNIFSKNLRKIYFNFKNLISSNFFFNLEIFENIFLVKSSRYSKNNQYLVHFPYQIIYDNFKNYHNKSQNENNSLIVLQYLIIPCWS